MAEIYLVSEPLTDAMIEAGAELTRQLDVEGLSPEAALWFFMPESGHWKLIFAGKTISSKGPLEVYRVIGIALRRMGDIGKAIPMFGVTLLELDSDPVTTLRTAIQTGPGIAQIRFAKNAVNGHFIDDALIYRI